MDDPDTRMGTLYLPLEGLKYVFQSGKARFPKLFFFRNVLSIGPFLFHIKFRIILSGSFRDCASHGFVL